MSKNLALPPSLGRLADSPYGRVDPCRSDSVETSVRPTARSNHSPVRDRKGEDLPTGTDRAVPVVIAFTVSSGRTMLESLGGGDVLPCQENKHHDGFREPPSDSRPSGQTAAFLGRSVKTEARLVVSRPSWIIAGKRSVHQ